MSNLTHFRGILFSVNLLQLIESDTRYTPSITIISLCDREIPKPQFNFTLPYSECRGHGTGAINGSETSRLNVSIASTSYFSIALRERNTIVLLSSGIVDD